MDLRVAEKNTGDDKNRKKNVTNGLKCNVSFENKLVYKFWFSSHKQLYVEMATEESYFQPMTLLSSRATRPMETMYNEPTMAPVHN